MKLIYNLTLVILLLSANECLAAKYTTTYLGFSRGLVSSAIGISQNGLVTGYASLVTNNDFDAFLYDGIMHDLGPLGERASFGFDVNSTGQVTGWSEAPEFTRAFLYDGTMHDLGTLGGMNSFGTAINENGQITGGADNGYNSHAFLYDGTMHDLGTLGGAKSDGYGINDRGEVTGSSWILGDAARHAFLYDGTMRDLGTLGGRYSGGLDINIGGHVTGYSDTTGDLASHAFLYDGAMHDLGTLGGNSSSGHGINASGQVVGSSRLSNNENHAFIYDTVNGMIDLNSLIDPLPGFPEEYLTGANAINDAGQIVATSGNYFQFHGYLLTPVPEPSGEVLAVLGLLGLAAWGWRRSRH